MTTSAATSEDDRRLYRQWIEAEWWPLYGEKFDAIGLALGHKPVLVSQPGKRPFFAFEVDPQAAEQFLLEVYEARRASNAVIEDGDPIGFAVGLPSPTPPGGPSPEATDPMFAEIESEDPEPELVEWKVPEDARGRSYCVRAYEFVEWAIRMDYPVPPVVVEGVRAKFQRRDALAQIESIEGVYFPESQRPVQDNAIADPGAAAGAIDRTQRDAQGDAVDSTRRAVRSVFPEIENLTADEISIAFVGDKHESGLAGNDMLEVSARGQTRRVLLAELDLVNRRKCTLNSQAAILVGMTRKTPLPRSDANARKMSRLREVFRKHLGIKDDPFEPYRKGVGWVPRFKIADRRGLADERAQKEAERRTISFDQLKEHGDRQLADADQSRDSSDHESDEAGAWLDDNDPDYSA